MVDCICGSPFLCSNGLSNYKTRASVQRISLDRRNYLGKLSWRQISRVTVFRLSAASWGFEPSTGYFSNISLPWRVYWFYIGLIWRFNQLQLARYVDAMGPFVMLVVAVLAVRPWGWDHGGWAWGVGGGRGSDWGSWVHAFIQNPSPPCPFQFVVSKLHFKQRW